MKRSDSRIGRRDALVARGLQLVYPALNRLMLSSPKVEFATSAVPPPTTVRIPTRFGSIDALVHSPSAETLAATRARGQRPPVHVLLHGGAFILQYPKSEGNVARYLAAELGCYVVMPDYRAAPQVRHPVAELECFDAYRWVREHGDVHGWDRGRVSIGGPSAGGHLSLSVTFLAIDEGYPPPEALSVEFASVDLGLTPDQRRSETKKRPVISPGLIGLVIATYFKDVDPASPQASPIQHPRIGELPPLLVLTAEHDSLRAEAERFADKAKAAGAEVTYRMVVGVDHGFLARPPVVAAREGVTAIAAHLDAAYTRQQLRTSPTDTTEARL